MVIRPRLTPSRPTTAVLREAIKCPYATERADSSYIDRLQARGMHALLARIAASAGASDQVGARQVVERAHALGLSRANLRKLSARANDIPGPREPLDRLPGDMVLVRNGSSMLAASQRPVSRDEYARCARATGRRPARRRVSA